MKLHEELTLSLNFFFMRGNTSVLMRLTYQGWFVMIASLNRPGKVSYKTV